MFSALNWSAVLIEQTSFTVFLHKGGRNVEKVININIMLRLVVTSEPTLVSLVFQKFMR